MAYDKNYPDLYQGYFNYRDPFTENLEKIYQNPLVIPIYHLDELFNEEALAAVKKLNEIGNDAAFQAEFNDLNAQLIERDQHIFKYFHFIAAQRYVLDDLRNKYRDYYELEHTLKQFEAIGYDVSKARETDLVKRKKQLLDFQAHLCQHQLV